MSPGVTMINIWTNCVRNTGQAKPKVNIGIVRN